MVVTSEEGNDDLNVLSSWVPTVLRLLQPGRLVEIDCYGDTVVGEYAGSRNYASLRSLGREVELTLLSFFPSSFSFPSFLDLRLPQPPPRLFRP